MNTLSLGRLAGLSVAALALSLSAACAPAEDEEVGSSQEAVVNEVCWQNNAFDARLNRNEHIYSGSSWFPHDICDSVRVTGSARKLFNGECYYPVTFTQNGRSMSGSIIHSALTYEPQASFCQMSSAGDSPTTAAECWHNGPFEARVNKGGSPVWGNPNWNHQSDTLSLCALVNVLGSAKRDARGDCYYPIRYNDPSGGVFQGWIADERLTYSPNATFCQ